MIQQKFVRQISGEMISHWLGTRYFKINVVSIDIIKDTIMGSNGTKERQVREQVQNLLERSRSTKECNEWRIQLHRLKGSRASFFLRNVSTRFKDRFTSTRLWIACAFIDKRTYKGKVKKILSNCLVQPTSINELDWEDAIYIRKVIRCSSTLVLSFIGRTTQVYMVITNLL